MASIFKASAERLPVNRQAQRLNAMPALVVPPAVKVAGSTVNGHSVTYGQLEELQMRCKYMVAGGYLKNEVQDVATTVETLSDTFKELESKYDHVGIQENPECFVCVNNLDVPDGVWWYEYHDCLGHEKVTRDALISGLWLLSEAGFQTATETEAWSYMQDEAYSERFEQDDDDDTKELLAEYNKCVKFYKKKPIKLKWRPRAFHHHASQNTALGDWLRCCWHYRKFNWFDFDGQELIDEGGERGVMMQEQYRIIYVWNDQLCDVMYEEVDSTWQNFGSQTMADSRVISEDGIVHEERCPDKEQRDKLARDFTKLWTFDLEKLEYLQLYRTEYNGSLKTKKIPVPKPVIIPNEYDYIKTIKDDNGKRKLRAKAATDNIRKSGKQQRVRRTGTTKKRRSRVQPAVVA